MESEAAGASTRTWLRLVDLVNHSKVSIEAGRAATMEICGDDGTAGLPSHELR